MKRRLEALTRIGRLQALMYDLGRWRLHTLERQQAGLNDDLKAVFEILDADEVANGIHAGLVARRIRTLQLAHARDAGEACRAGDRSRDPRLSTLERAQGAGRDH